jgi:hypothetical protein
MTDVRDVTIPLAARDPEVTRRLREHVLAGTTDLAAGVLSVPIRYYQDPELFAREKKMLLTTPIAVLASPSCRTPTTMSSATSSGPRCSSPVTPRGNPMCS